MESLGTAESSQASSVTMTRYNKGGSLVIPPDRRRGEYGAELEVAKGSAGTMDAFSTHSTTAN